MSKIDTVSFMELFDTNERRTEIDTISFMELFDKNERKIEIEKQIKIKLLKKYNEKQNEYCYTGKYNDYSFYFSQRYDYLIVTLKHNLIKGKTVIQIINETNNFVKNYFGLNDINFKLENINRIDYKYDYKYKTEFEKDIIMNLLEKSTKKIGINYHKKITDKGFDKAKYTSAGSGCMEIIFYDKGAEMEKLYKKNKCTKEEAEKYKNIFRTEVRVKNARLNYEKRKYGISKNIINYYNLDVARMYIKYYITKVLGKEKFYRIDIAKKLIQNAKKLKEKMKEKLCNLLDNINKNGFTYAQESYKNRKTFYTHIKRIRELNINVLTFDKKIKGKDIKQEKMDNFAIENNEEDEEDKKDENDNT